MKHAYHVYGPMALWRYIRSWWNYYRLNKTWITYHIFGWPIESCYMLIPHLIFSCPMNHIKPIHTNSCHYIMLLTATQHIPLFLSYTYYRKKCAVINICKYFTFKVHISDLPQCIQGYFLLRLRRSLCPSDQKYIFPAWICKRCHATRKIL